MHIGQLIEKVFNERKISKAELGRRINTSRQNVSALFNRADMDVKQLFTISKALDYDFFKHFRINEQTEDVTGETEVSIKFRVKADNLDDLLEWVSSNGTIDMTKKSIPYKTDNDDNMRVTERADKPNERDKHK